MFNMYVINQYSLFLLLLILLIRTGTLAKTGPSIVFFTLHIFFYYLLPQAALLIAAAGGSSTVNFYRASSGQVTQAQIFILIFIFLFCLSRIATDMVIMRPSKLLPSALTLTTDPIAIFSFYVLSTFGLGCLLLFAARLGGVTYRSEAVSDLSGQLLLAGSFLCHFFLVLLALTWWFSGKKIAAVLLILITSALFLYLGGRSRAFFVIIYFAWLVMLFRIKVSVPRVLVALATLVAIMPIWNFAKNLSVAWRTGATISSVAGWDTLAADTLTGGNMAGSFLNLAQVVGYAGTVNDTPGVWFMRTFYPEVYAIGVSFNLGMIGEAYVLGGVAAVITIAIVLGAASSIIDRVFIMSHAAGTRLFCMILATWLFAVGWNLIDSFLKVTAVMLGPGIWAIATMITSTVSIHSRTR